MDYKNLFEFALSWKTQCLPIPACNLMIVTYGRVTTLPIRLLFAIISACGVYFRPFGPQIGLQPRYRPAASIFGLSGLILACGLNTHATYTALQRSTALHYQERSIMMLMMRYHGDDVYMTSQPIAVQTDTFLFLKI